MNTCLQKQTRMHLYMDFNLPVLFSIGLSRSQSTFSNMLQENKNILNIMYFLVICRVRLKYRHTWLTLVLVWFGFGCSDSCFSCQNGHVATCRLESGFSIFLRQWAISYTCIHKQKNKYLIQLACPSTFLDSI